MPKILLAGGTGLIGQRLCHLLSAQGYEITLLSRRNNADVPYPIFRWNPIAGQMDERALDGVDYLLNLAGAGIADKPWTTRQKKLLVDSRVKSNELLIRTLKTQNKTVKAFLSASAVGYYGHRGSEPLTESALPGNDGFLSECCIAWENAALKASPVAERLLIVRIGIVLSASGGALEKMVLPFRFGVGNYVGKGGAYISWIHIDDLCRIFIKGINDVQMTGIYNGTAPHPATSKAMAKAIRKTLARPVVLLPVPTLVLRMVLRERATMLTSSARAVPKRLLAEGFEFHYPELGEALDELLEK